MSKGLVDVAEELGAAVAAGLLVRDVAVQQLMEFSDGGLTRRGADDLLTNWQTSRVAYEGVFGRCRESLRRLGVDPDEMREGES